MDKKSDFTFADIILKDNKTRYQAGEDVLGIIKLALKGSTIVTNLKIILVCVSEVEWEDRPNTLHFTKPYSYHDKIILIKETFPLPKEYENLSEGEHEVPFTFKLPEKGTYSSFVGPHGSIKYFIEVLSEEHGENEGQRIVLYEFKVDVPNHDNLKLSIGCSKEKDFGLLSLASGKVTLYASFIKKGWAPGESIELHVTVDNQSTVDVKPRATLYQIQIYKSERGHKALQIPITDTSVGEKVEELKNFTQVLFIPTPKDIPLTIKSPLISVKYFVHVTLDIPHSFDIHVNVPVVMTNKSVQSAN